MDPHNGSPYMERPRLNSPYPIASLIVLFALVSVTRAQFLQVEEGASLARLAQRDELPPELTWEAQSTAESELLLSYPNPGEVFGAFGTNRQPRWRQFLQVHGHVPAGSRLRIAARMGMMLTDCHVAVASRDVQEVRNATKDLLKSAKALALTGEIAGTESRIIAYSEQSAWVALGEQFDELCGLIVEELIRQKDDYLVPPFLFGAWLRSMEVVLAPQGESYTEEQGRLIRQPVVARRLFALFEQLPERHRESDFVAALLEQFPPLVEAVSFAADSVPSDAEVATVDRIVSEMMGVLRAHVPEPPVE